MARLAEKLSIDVEPITRRQLAELAEYDGLFIRETTSIDNHTYRFARRAWQEGMPVIDDPISMIRCTNKVFLMELLGQNQVATPPTVMLADVGDLSRAMDELGLPLVVKIPDGSFSRGVHKVDTPEEFRRIADELFEETDLLLAQKFLPTEFDWRVGVLSGEPLFVCQYRMARGHWQIVKHRPDGSLREGGFRTFELDQAPRELIDIAVRAAAPIGAGFYGVDIKQTDRGFIVMEVNDNPESRARRRGPGRQGRNLDPAAALVRREVRAVGRQRRRCPHLAHRRRSSQRRPPAWKPCLCRGPMIDASVIRAVAAAATAALLCASAAAQPLEKVSFGTNWVAQAEHGGLYQALADGTYRNYGLDVTIVPGGPNVNSRILLPVGKLDFHMIATAAWLRRRRAEHPDHRRSPPCSRRIRRSCSPIPTRESRPSRTSRSSRCFSRRRGRELFPVAQGELRFPRCTGQTLQLQSAAFPRRQAKRHAGLRDLGTLCDRATGRFKPKLFLLADHGFDSYSTLIETRRESGGEASPTWCSALWMPRSSAGTIISTATTGRRTL